FGITSEGGEATTIGSLQNKTLRTKYSPRTETMTFTLQQFDVAGLKLYYGANAPILPDGSVGVPVDPVPTTCAFLVVFVDGENHFAFYAPKAEIYRSDDVSFGDTESLAGLPIGVKPLPHGQNDWTYAVTPLGGPVEEDRKSTRLNSSHVKISYAVFCLKKKKKKRNDTTRQE